MRPHLINRDPRNASTVERQCNCMIDQRQPEKQIQLEIIRMWLELSVRPNILFGGLHEWQMLEGYVQEQDESEGKNPS